MICVPVDCHQFTDTEVNLQILNCHSIVLNFCSFSISYVFKVVLKRRLGQESILTLYKVFHLM